MASVWVARERGEGAADRLIAVKAMLPELAQKQDFRRMFLDEGKIVSSIQHPNVVTVYEVAEDSGILYMGMEWVEGASVRAIIRDARRRRAIPPEMAVRMIADTAAALHAAHELRGPDGKLCGLVHCDVSPHNILIGLEGNAKLVDFGVAHATALTGVAQSEEIKGKLGYMSPEQAHGDALDRRSDVFSLGVVLFELMTGQRLFQGENAAHALQLVQRCQIPKPSNVYDKYPKEIEQITLRALSREKSQRFQTAEEFRQALERYLVDERIMVPRAGVAQLLKRVVGSRITEQREEIADALRTLDGSVQHGLIPSMSVAASIPSVQPPASHPSVTPASLSNPPASGPLSSAPLSGPMAQAAMASGIVDSRDASSSTSSSTPEPQVVPPGPRSRSSLLFAGVGLLAAAIAVGFFYAANSAQSQTQMLGGDPAPGKQNDSPAPSSAPVEPEMSLDSLPIAKLPDPTAPVSPGASKSRHKKVKPVKVRLEEEPDPNSKSKKSSKPAKALKVTLEETPESPPREATREQPPPPPKTDRGPFNRGAAIAALGSAALNAARCKKPGGPTGRGQATVMFHPDGYVQAVGISAPFTGTSAGNCVASLFKRARVSPFSGSSVTVQRGFRIPD